MERPKVLVADDDATIRSVVEELLADFCDVVTACDGDEALLAAEAHQPRLVVLDIQMPVKDGIQVLESLRQRQDALNAVPVLMLTGLDTQLAERYTTELGARKFLAKPFSGNELRAAVQDLLAV